MSQSADTDNRREIRIQVTPPMAAGVNITRSERISGLVMDISRNGIAFRYLEYDKTLPPDTPVELELTSPGAGFNLRHLAAIVVSDARVEEICRYCIIPMRKCALQFTNLNQEQRDSLAVLLHTLRTGHQPLSPTQ